MQASVSAMPFDRATIDCLGREVERYSAQDLLDRSDVNMHISTSLLVLNMIII